MGEKTPPRKWKQPTGERDAIRRPPTSPVVAEPAAPQTFYDDLESLTPKPMDMREITPNMAWDHANRIAQRNANMLSAIAQSSGVGMDVGDEVADLKKQVKQHASKLKWWQALILAALTAAGTAILGAAKGLYTKGEKEGAMEIRVRQLELQMDRNYDAIDKLRDEISRMIRRRDQEPVRNQ